MSIKKVKLPNNTVEDINDGRVKSDAIIYEGDTIDSATYTADGIVVDLSDYQEELVSGTNIKTVNNQSLLGSGNLTVSGAKVYAFNYLSWAYDIEDGHLVIPLATYEEMVEDAQNGVPVILRLQNYSTSGGVITLGDFYDFYLYYHYFYGSTNNYLYFFNVTSWSGTFFRGIDLRRDGNTVYFTFSQSQIEFTYDRVNSITGPGTTYQYPSTKAVVDYVAANGGLPQPSSGLQLLESYYDYASSTFKWRTSQLVYGSSAYLNVVYSGGIYAFKYNTIGGPRNNTEFQLKDAGLVAEASSNNAVFSDWSWIKYRSSYSPSAYVTLQDTLDSIALPPVTSADYGKMLFVDYDSTKGYHWSKNAPMWFNSQTLFLGANYEVSLADTNNSGVDISPWELIKSIGGNIPHNWSWLKYRYYDTTAQTYIDVSLQDTLDTKQDLLVSGTNIKTINNQSLLGSGNITISGGGDTSSCVHITGDESVGGDKTFTDNIAVVDASHILYSGASPSQGFTRGTSSQFWTGIGSTLEVGSDEALAGEPKAFIISVRDVGASVLLVVGDSTGVYGIYNTGSQHNYSAGFTKSYSNGILTITAPTGVTFGDYVTYDIVYYYGDGTLAFKTTTIQPGSGVTAVTFTGTDLTEVPAMYACFLESAVNNEQYRRVAGYTNSAYSGSAVAPEGITFLTGGPTNTTSSFTASYNNGLVINSGGTNAGGYFHNPGTYTLYYLMASDIGSGGSSGSYSSLADELAAINTTIGDIETILASI